MGGGERVTWKHTSPYVTQTADGNLRDDSGSSAQGSGTTLRSAMGREVGGRFRREGTWVNQWQIHADVWQKPTQYCKVVIVQ